MAIDPITSINRVTQLAAPGQTGQSGQVGSALDEFGEMLAGAINSLSQKETAANQLVSRLAAGEDVELHQVMLATQEADIAFQMALQVRNKIVDAYQEVMRMTV